jgi:UDP-N-acetyl-D-galactosamine dehydrogenase
LESYGATVDIFDPQADTEEVKDEYGLSLTDKPNKKYNAIVLAVSHDEFNLLDLHSLLLKGGVIYDVKGVLDRSKTTASL